MTESHGGPATCLLRGPFAVVVAGCLVLAVVAGLLGHLFGGDVASGGRAPVRSALWAVCGAAAALPVAVLPWLGSRVGRRLAVSSAGGLASALALAGFLCSAG